MGTLTENKEATPEQGQALTGVVLLPEHYQVLDLNQDGLMALRFWFTKDKSDPKPLNIVLPAAGIADLIIAITGTMTNIFERKNADGTILNDEGLPQGTAGPSNKADKA